VLSTTKRAISTLEVEKEALKMEKSEKNKARLEEIEQELSNLKEKQRNLEAQFENEKETFNAISNIKVQIEQLKNKAAIAKRESRFEEAAQIEYGQIPALEEKIKENEEKWAKMQESGTLLRNFVDDEAIASIVSRWTGIPVNKMLTTEKERRIRSLW